MNKNANCIQENKKKAIEIVKELEATWYGMKEFYIKNCNGYILEFVERK